MFPKIPGILVSTLFLLGSPHSSLAWDISSSGVTSSAHCAKVFTQEKFQGSSFFMKDKEQIPYMSDMQSWDETTKISFKVKPSCTLTIATQPFLQGNQHDLTTDTDSFQFEDEESFQNRSIQCSCHKSCSCDDVTFRGRECARGYFDRDCTDCDAYYTSFKQGGKILFPSKFESAVTSFIVRPTCSLKVQYRTEPNGASETIDIHTDSKSEVVPFTGLISSTSCECDTLAPAYKSTKARQPKTSDPTLLSISNLRGEINAQLKKPGQENHPGLLAALQSLRAKRSPKNAYILLMGLTGSGKSTAVNLLFDHPNITQVGSAQSTTTDIHEFRIPVQMDELGIKNSELRVIDTPGIADTRGIAQDARFLATLDQYLTKHEELKRTLPNLILICVKFTDNRFDGDGSAFVKMLKTIELFRSRLIDPKFSNIIFVLTHFMSETKEIQRDSGAKIQRFKRVIEEYSSLPKPIVLVVAENKPEVSELLSLNGYWTLPNGDVYPKNLFDQMQRTLSSCGDPIGLGVIQTAFSHSDEFKIEGKSFPILPKTHKNVGKYLSELSALERPPASSEVTEALDVAYGNLSPELKSKYPAVLTHLKRVCSLRKLDRLNKIPKTSPKILEFLRDVQLNPASIFLLETGLDLSVPLFEKAYVVGSGYDIKHDKSLGAPIFNLSLGFYPSEIGFQLPQHIKVSLSSAIRNVFAIMPSRHEYVETRLQNLGLEQDSSGLEDLLSSSGETKVGLNIVASPDQQDLKLSALIEYQTFNMMLDNEATLSDDFLLQLRSLGQFDENNFESVRAWNSFFQLYGTHAVVGASGGGYIAVEVKMNDLYQTNQDFNEASPSHLTEDEQNDEETDEDTPEDSDYQTANQELQSQIASVDRFTRLSQAMSLILQYLANNFLGKETPVTIPEGLTYSIRMLGGNPNFYISNITHHRKTVEVWHILDKWQTSVQYQPEVLTSYLKLIPISEILHNIPGLETEASAVKEASKVFLNASLVYIPSVVLDNSLEDREHSGVTTTQIGDFQSVQEFARVFEAIAAQSQKTQDNFMATMLELQRDNQRKDELFVQRQREDRILEMQWQKELKENEKWEQEMQFRREQIAQEREKDDKMTRIQMYQTDAQLKVHQAAQINEMQARNQETFIAFISEQSRMQHELAIAQINKKSWLDKTFDFVGGIFGGAQQSAVAAAPMIAAAMG